MVVRTCRKFYFPPKTTSELLLKLKLLSALTKLSLKLRVTFAFSQIILFLWKPFFRKEFRPAEMLVFSRIDYHQSETAKNKTHCYSLKNYLATKRRIVDLRKDLTNSINGILLMAQEKMRKSVAESCALRLQPRDHPISLIITHAQLP